MYELGVVYRNIQRADSDLAAKLGAFGAATVHEAMGRVGLMKPYMRPVYAGAPGVGHRRHGPAAPRRQLDAARCGRADPARRHRRRGGDSRVHRRLLRRSPGDELQGARRTWARHRCRRARRARADRNEVPGVEQGDLRQGHGEGYAGFGEHSGRVRRRAGDAGRRHRRRRRRRGRRAGGARRRRRSRPRPRAKPTKARSARSSRPACSASTCTTCASRCRKPGCDTSIEGERRHGDGARQVSRSPASRRWRPATCWPSWPTSIERRSGRPVAIVSVGGVDAVRRVQRRRTVRLRRARRRGDRPVGGRRARRPGQSNRHRLLGRGDRGGGRCATARRRQ